MRQYKYLKSNAFTMGASLGNPAATIFTEESLSPEQMQQIATEHKGFVTRVFAPKFGYLEDPATGSGNSAFANYLLSENMWDGSPISIEQGGNNRVFNSVKLKVVDGKVLFGGRATTKIEGWYHTA